MVHSDTKANAQEDTKADKKARMLWRCRRGMLELDLLLIHFVQSQFDHLSCKQVQALEDLIEQNDPELLNWLMGYSSPVDQKIHEIIKLIQTNHCPPPIR